jgi:hypothetical protein
MHASVDLRPTPQPYVHATRNNTAHGNTNIQYTNGFTIQYTVLRGK